MKTIISKRLYTILPTAWTSVKLHGIEYYAKVRFFIKEETVTDYYICQNNDEPFESEYNYFCYNKSSKITAWPTAQGEQPVNGDGGWKREGRQELKPGKFLMMFADAVHVQHDGYSIEDSDLITKVFARLCEIFTDGVRAVNTEFTYDVSTEVSRIYALPEHEDSGYLQNSCMRRGSPHDCSEYAMFYDLIPDLKIVYKEKNGKLLFRALLWQINVEGIFYTFLDRVYGSEQTNIALIEIARQNGWAYRTFGSSRLVFEEKYLWGTVNIPEHAFEYLENCGSPYVDTFSYLTDLQLTNKDDNYTYSLTSCDGTAVCSRHSCTECGVRVDEDAMYHVDSDIYCYDCYFSLFFDCDKCMETYPIDEIRNCDGIYYCAHCAEKRGYYKCDNCDEYHNDGTYVDHVYYCDSCLHERCGVCDECGCFTIYDDLKTEIVNGESLYICDDCAQNYERCIICHELYSGTESEYALCDTCNEEDGNILIAMVQKYRQTAESRVQRYLYDVTNQKYNLEGQARNLVQSIIQ